VRTEQADDLGNLLVHEDWSDPEGAPAGGCYFGPGFCISWQNGPLGRSPNRKPQNGAFVEHILEAAFSRLDYYQSTRFACEANAKAMLHIEAAFEALAVRTSEREERGIEGTHEV
jgi:hypothetical protein